MNPQIKYLTPGTYNILSILFHSYSTIYSGGAMYFDNIGIKTYVWDCSFFSCSASNTDSRGGAIAVSNINVFDMRRICFSNCFGTYGSSFVLLAHVCTVNEMVVTYTSEVNGVSNQHGPCPGSKNYIDFGYNNHSRTSAPVYCGGYLFLDAPVLSTVRYSQVCDSYTACLVSMYITKESICYDRWNMINNTLVSGSLNGGWVQIHNQNTKVQLNNLVFLKNNMIGKIFNMYGSSATLTLNFCSVDQDLSVSFFSNCIKNSCISNNNPYLNNFAIYKSYLCIGTNVKPTPHHSIRPYTAVLYTLTNILLN